MAAPRTYTEHELTDAQLRRLSALYQYRSPKAGVALQALERKGLATTNRGRDAEGVFHLNAKITDKGIAAFQAARREGW